MSKEDKLYTTETNETIAEHCMVKLLTKYPNGEDHWVDISLQEILNQNRT